MHETKNIKLNLSFENVSLPPFNDILIITKKSPHGRLGVISSLNLLVPDCFGLIEVKHDVVEAVMINKRILKKIDEQQIIKILSERVFPYIEPGELIKVDFNLKISFSNVEVGKGE